MGRRYRGGRGTALRPRRRAGPRTGFSPRRRGTGTPRPAREPETKRTVFAAILLRPSLRCKRETLARVSLSSPSFSSSPRPAARSESTREATDLGGHGFRRNRGRDARARRFEWKRTRGGEVLTCSATRLSCPLSLSLYRLGRIILDIIIYYFAACGRNTFFERIFFEEYIVVVNYRAMRKRGEREERFQGWDGFDDRLSPSPSNTALWRRAPVRTAV